MARRLLKPTVFLACLLPLASILVDWQQGTLPDPVALTLNRLGFWTLTLLVLTLACTPAKLTLGWVWPNKVRRMLGLYAFFYGCLHFAVYAGLDQEMNLADIGADIVERKFITIGFVALMLLVPLAVTSTQRMTRRLGFRAWRRLHRLAYVSAALAVVHFLWRVKADISRPLAFGLVLTLLMGVRLWEVARQGSKRRIRISTLR
ncbi:MAG TPA: protein-methionine-sulfoxide reductase heme-binding subunit MsrQ [Myxococcota bacterium]|nr:protein-methionine-sulfoxide reductase heme-binding subunit MsrQ [Myxococcota bacterium]